FTLGHPRIRDKSLDIGLSGEGRRTCRVLQCFLWLTIRPVRIGNMNEDVGDTSLVSYFLIQLQAPQMRDKRLSVIPFLVGDSSEPTEDPGHTVFLPERF